MIESKDVILSGIHLELTDALRSYVEEKSARLLRHEPGILKIQVDLERNANRSHSDEFIARGIISISGANNFVAQSAADDLYRAIDEMTDRLDRQIKSHASQELTQRREN